MLCEICNKNEATIHIQEIVGGKKKSLHLCSACAAAKQHGAGMDIGPFDLAGLLYKLSGAEGAEAPENAPEKEEKDEKKEQPTDFDGLSKKQKYLIHKVMQMSDAELDKFDKILSLVENAE